MHFLNIFDHNYSNYYSTPTLFQYIYISLILIGVLIIGLLVFFKLLQYFFKMDSAIVTTKVDNKLTSPFLITEHEEGSINLAFKPSLFQKFIVFGLIALMLFLPLENILSNDVNLYFWI